MIFKYSLFIIVTIFYLLTLPDPVSGLESGRDKYSGQQENHPDLSDNKSNLNLPASTTSTPVHYKQTLKQVTFTGSHLINVAWLSNFFLFVSTIFVANYIIQPDWSTSTLFSDIFSDREIDTTEELIDPMMENIIGKLVPRWKF